MSARIACLFLLALLAASSLRAEDAGPNPDITSTDLIAHIRRLASEEWEGRGTGSPGEHAASQYVADFFARLGLKPAGEGGSFFQEVPVPGGVKLGACSLAVLAADGKAAAESFALDKEFRPFSASASGKVEGDAVFAGYGIRAPELAYDDYAGFDASGKVVFVFRHAPRGERWRGRARATHAAFTAKLAHAVKAGAIALVVVNDPTNFPSPGKSGDAGVPGGRRGRGGPRPDTVHRGGVGPVEGPRIPFVHMTLAAARRVFPGLFGATPDELDAALAAGAASREGRARVRMQTTVDPVTLKGRNVLALLEAGDPGRVDEILVVGGHHDHLGRGMAGSLERDPKMRQTIHNGADDNASGTSGVLEVAAYMAARRAHLRRSILFMTFTGEERGLVGSAYFVNKPTVPLEKIVAMINMDMIGRLEEKKLFIGGVETSPVFMPLIQRVNQTIGLPLQPGAGGRAPSDNTSFFNKNKPVLFFFTGMHPDYHRPSDDWDKIDTDGIERVARLAGGVVDELARGTAPIVFKKVDQGGFGPPRAVLGISVGQAEGGVSIGAVIDDGPAARAGLRAGDIIIAIDGKTIDGLQALRKVMRSRKAGDKLKVRLTRGGQPLEVEVVLAQG